MYSISSHEACDSTTGLRVLEIYLLLRSCNLNAILLLWDNSGRAPARTPMRMYYAAAAAHISTTDSGASRTWYSVLQHQRSLVRNLHVHRTTIVQYTRLNQGPLGLWHGTTPLLRRLQRRRPGMAVNSSQVRRSHEYTQFYLISESTRTTVLKSASYNKQVKLFGPHPAGIGDR